MQSQPHPCECILKLRLSRLRSAFTFTCDLLDQHGWKVLCDHLISLRVLDSQDVSSINQASSLAAASPAKELLLRLERKNNIEFTVQTLLFYLKTLQLPQYSQVFMVVAPLHKQDCRTRFVNERDKILDALFSEASESPSQLISPVIQPFPNSGYRSSHDTTQYNLPMFNPHLGPRFSSMPPGMSPTLQVSREYSNNPTAIVNDVNRSSASPPFDNHSYALNSINNLSDPNETYLNIVEHPKDENLGCGEILILRCLAESDQSSINYSWKRDNIMLPDQKEKVLVISNVQLTDSGLYTCIVSCGKFLKATSNSAKVNINQIVDYENDCISATDKFALLIANEEYVNNSTLASAANDVAALASTLRDKLHFKTVSMINLTLFEMQKAVEVFCSYLIKGAYCVVYLAGHGFENDGQCYIVPTDAKKEYTHSDCFSVKKMITDITSRNLRLTMVLLDVCRKRNERAVKLPESMGNSKKLGNFVISFATMESGMAYEVKGRKLGAYVSCLQNHLSKDKRITRVLELVHQDMHKCELTRGVQQPEFKSNMFEDRKLTDQIISPFDFEKQCELNHNWNKVHVGVKPILFFFESCGVCVKLSITCLFSNVLLIEGHVIDKGGTKYCTTSINLTSDSQSQNGSSTSCIRLEDLQRLHTHMKILPISININYALDDFLFEESWHDNIDIPFITWWVSEC